METFIITLLMMLSSVLCYAQNDTDKLFDREHTVDYLVVYDMSNPSFIEQQGGRERYAQKVVDSINEVLENSNLNYCFRLAGVYYWDGYKAENIERGLNDLSNSDLIREKRRETKADIVVLLTESYGDVNSGLADHNDDAIHTDAYSCVNLSMAATSYTAAHEAGHILGAYHSRSEYDQAPSTHPWAAAYISPNGYRTVMNTMAPGTTVPVYSGPESLWEGEVMGDSIHDNVRMIRHNLPRVVNFGERLEFDKYYSSADEIIFDKNGGEGELSFYGNQFMMINSAEDWITQLSPTWANVQADVKFIIEPNNTGTERVGYIVVDGDANNPKKVKVIQTSSDINIDCNNGVFDKEEDCFVNELCFIRDFKDTEWQTLYIPFDLIYEDWKDCLEIASIDTIKMSDDKTEKLLQYEIIKDADIKANVPYLVRAKSEGRISLPLRNINLCACNEKSTDWNVDGYTYSMKGNYRKIAGQDMYNNGYYVINGDKLVCSYDVNAKLNAYRWYMAVTDSEGRIVKNDSNIRIVEKSSEDTSVEILTEEHKENTIYDLNGFSIPRNYKERNLTNKGVYIINGKKVLLR